MTGHEADPLLAALRRLPAAARDPRRELARLERCHAQLAGPRRTVTRVAAPGRVAARWVALIVAGFGTTYLAMTVRVAARLFGR